MQFIDPRQDLDGWAGRLGISREAVEIYAAADVIDLHIESFIWTRVWGYDLSRRHGRGLLGARLYSQVDFPRLLEAGMTGAVWSIATNPLRRQARRSSVCLKNIHRLRGIIEAQGGHLQLVTDASGYQRARQAGKVACWLALQGGNGLDSDPDDLQRIPDQCISRITLVHLSRSTLGGSSSPPQKNRVGLTAAGQDFVRTMNHQRILLDLAHISPRGFDQALEVHDPSQPAIVSHTGARAVHDSWRNLDDQQVRAIADTGGVIGVIFHCYFLDGSLLGSRADAVVDHLDHLIQTVGEDFVALGSDWDGMIVTPRDMQTVLELPVLVQRMLERGYKAGRIHKILGKNYLRVLRMIRG